MKKRILSLVLVLCLVVGLCPIFASAGGRTAYLVDMDGTVHNLGYNGDNGDGKTWSYDRRTETLTLNGYHGRCVFGILQKVILSKGSQNSLAGLYMSNPFMNSKHSSISGEGELILNYDESLLKFDQFKWGSINCPSYNYDMIRKTLFPCALGYYESIYPSDPRHGGLSIKDGLMLLGGTEEGNSSSLELCELDEDKWYFFEMPKTASGDKATYVRIAPAEPNPPTHPTPPTPSTSFTDVKPGAYYAEPVNWAVSWAVESNITVGYGNGKFLPKKGCTRAEAMTFIWRAAGRPEPSKIASFSDMPSNSDFQKAISWASENGITSGVGGNKFGPDKTCTRGQIVTFLYNAKDL